MTDDKLNLAKALETRIKELDAEIMALFDAPKKINPKKPFRCFGQIYGNYNSELYITLTRQDLNALQAIRSAERDHLNKLLKEL